MTTAARPTWDAARGGGGRDEKNLGVLSKQYSSRDLPSHTKLKYRQTGQGTSQELKSKDFKRELEERERQARQESTNKRSSSSGTNASLPSISPSPSSSSVPSIKDKDDSSGPSSKKPKIDTAILDADEPIDDDLDSDEDDSDEEDDTAELLAELQRIKKERAAEEARREAERKAQEERIRMENIMTGNPLLAGSGKSDFKVKRRWNDDVVFKNCARGEPEQKGKNFINDTLRSDFHRKFMEKYIK